VSTLETEFVEVKWSRNVIAGALFSAMILSGVSALLEFDVYRGAHQKMGEPASNWCLVSAGLDSATSIVFGVMAGLCFFKHPSRAACWAMRFAALLALSAAFSECGERVVVNRDLMRAGLANLSMEELVAIWLSAGAFVFALIPWGYYELSTEEVDDTPIPEVSEGEEIRQIVFWMVALLGTLSCVFGTVYFIGWSK
jgi:hypothetical protein